MKSGARWAGIARFGSIGDNLIVSSVLPGLKKRYDFVEVISGKPMHVMFENNPYIDKLTVLEEGKPDWGDGHAWQAWFAERAKEYAFFANLSHSCEDTCVLMRAQTQYWWPAEMRRKLCHYAYLEVPHDVCGIPYDEIAPGFFPTDEELAQAADTSKHVGEKAVGWLISGSRVDKVYPHADVAIRIIIKKLGRPVIMFGAPGKDFELAKAIQQELVKLNGNDDGLHLALSPDPAKPTWPPLRICTQLQQCDLVIGPDTGPMWAVAMSDQPKIMLASHAGLNVTKHWKNTVTLYADQKRVPCFPCHRLHDTGETCVPNADKNGSACISDIGVSDLVYAVEELLARRPILGDYFRCGVAES